jgi:hypothetical protein
MTQTLYAHINKRKKKDRKKEKKIPIIGLSGEDAVTCEHPCPKDG